MGEDFTFTPFEVQSLARQVAGYFIAQGYQVGFEKPLDKNVHYVTTILATKRPRKILVEVQIKPDYNQLFRDFVLSLRADRVFSEIVLAIPADAELNVTTLGALKKDGIGIIYVHEEEVVFYQTPLNPALTVTLHPALRLGQHKEEVEEAISTFNSVNKKNGLRDMCEIVEGATRRLLKKAIRKGLVITNVQAADGDWSNCINILASPGQYVAGYQPLFDGNLKNDFHSFRGARNLLDHPTRNQHERKRLELQFVERIAMGPRLIAEINRLSRRIS